MSIKDMGGPAFPQSLNGSGHFGGMRLWDYYAAAAMPMVGQLLTIPGAQSKQTLTEAVICAQIAEFADAMLAERAKRMETKS